MRNKALQGLFIMVVCFILQGCSLFAISEWDGVARSPLSNMKIQMGQKEMVRECNKAGVYVDPYTQDGYDKCISYTEAKIKQQLTEEQKNGVETISNRSSELYNLSF